MEEHDLIKKYKTAGIVKGSLRKGRGKHDGKNVVDLKCRHCGTLNRSVATSDVWLKNCTKCGEKLSAKKRGKRVAK